MKIIIYGSQYGTARKYAGGVLGMKKTLAKISQCQKKKIIIATEKAAITKSF